MLSISIPAPALQLFSHHFFFPQHHQASFTLAARALHWDTTQDWTGLTFTLSNRAWCSLRVLIWAWISNHIHWFYMGCKLLIHAFNINDEVGAWLSNYIPCFFYMYVITCPCPYPKAFLLVFLVKEAPWENVLFFFGGGGGGGGHMEWASLNVLLKHVKVKQLSFCFQVDLVRQYHFRNSGQTYSGVPVIAANMDTVGTFEMAAAMAKVRWMLIFRFYFMQKINCKTSNIRRTLVGNRIVDHSDAGLGSIPELELELIPIPIPGIGIEKELNKRNWNW